MSQHIQISVKELFGGDAFNSTLKAEYIDRSDLEAFALCPHQGQLRKKHEGEYETHETLPETGKIIHSIAETAIKSCNYDLQEAADYITEELPKARPDLQPEVLRAGRTLANRLRWSRATQVILCEEQITRSIMPATETHGELLITTKPDLVLATNTPDKISVVDYKTGWKQRTNNQAKDEFQTCVICWTLKGKFPHIRHIDFRYWETRTNTIAYAHIDLEQIVGGTQDAPLTQEMAFEQRIFEAARLYLEGCNEAWPSEAKCSMCPVIKHCKYAEPICTELNDNPEEFGKNFIVLEETISQMKKAIAAADEVGRIIYVPDGYIDGSPKRKTPRRISFKSLKENGNS